MNPKTLILAGPSKPYQPGAGIVHRLAFQNSPDFEAEYTSSDPLTQDGRILQGGFKQKYIDDQGRVSPMTFNVGGSGGAGNYSLRFHVLVKEISILS